MSNKLNPTLNTKLRYIFASKNQDPILIIIKSHFNGFLNPENWDFASISGLGTWDPKVNWPFVLGAMIKENRQLVTNKPVEFEK